HLVGRAAEHLAGQPSSLTVQFDLASDLQAVQGSGPQLLRVISNLISNARDAMGDVGILAIGTENVTLDRALGTYPRVEPGPYVRLSVEDTGSGIDQAILDRIFDAFFTTKPPGKRTGSGLGLSIVQSLVADHHGAIEVESELGRGTTFHIYLPATRQSPRERRNEPAPHGNEAILVVDDDAGQREVSRRVLEMLGYQVAVVTSGEEAVDALREKPADLLVLDMILEGGIDGAETYRRVLEEWPAQRAIILSGFAESARVQAAQALGAGAYIRKPATIERLARAVRAELDRPSGERRVVLDEEEIPPQ
ncbi:MAG: two-component system, cell cycle sensor histidine kinase and response regulator CckA, partial [Chloroflexota bacterium]|nr:two-component system, cell cycle sensor histidine kinase and response regulator CckA [Chloroflexota bacterium]